MTTTSADVPARSLRLWPGVLAAFLLLAVRFGVPVVAPESMDVAMLGGLAGALLVTAWWLFFSRAPRSERWRVALFIAVVLAATWFASHESIATGMMGLLIVIYAAPILGLVFVAWAVWTRELAPAARRLTLAAGIVLACAAWPLLRSDGITAGSGAQFAWRWSETAEDRLLDASDELAAAPALSAPAMGAAEWPGFRGPRRDSIVRGPRIATDWSTSAPVELWQRAVGPGWSSFAVRGDLFYTQEQRGEEEVVACHLLRTGEPVWRHSDPTRFWEANAGAGPRATPTIDGEHVFSFGATGILNALDAATGELVWSRNVADDTNTELPYWGFSASPLVTDELVIIAASGVLAAYDRADGEPRWTGPRERASYSSPQLLVIAEVEQVVLLSDAGASSFAPADGTLLWEHELPGASIVQPALTADGALLVSSGERSALRRLALANGPNGWVVEDVWSSIRLKPNFNDFVIHAGHAFGFDGSILACIDVTDGKRAWKGGRYGNGQLVLLAEQDVLLVLTDEGELALVAADPSEFKELARVPAIEGKTWNHPVLVGDVLLVRNDQTMAAFRIALADG